MRNYLKTQQNQFGQMTGSSLEENVTAFTVQGDISGRYVRLVDVAHGITDQAAGQLWEAVSTEPDERCWTYLPYSAPQSQQSLKDSLQNLFGFKDSSHFLIEVAGEVQGWVALLNPRLAHGAVEIGNVYFSHKMKQSRVATETIFLLLQQCLNNGFRRVEWKCDDCNEPSKTAALRFGFQYEGLFRQDRIIKGRNRNTVWFSMIDDEWPELAHAYQQWLSPENFDQRGVQKQRLSELTSRLG
ncbi:GNAT family N-acetyltransferase [Acinetobacter sp.]|uniref:GNAT family N-acetyltransferase n=1 Tax=Acinetobacter sp. TaxID=472 RepID=UPI002FDACD6B